jgi:hypothetical protein
MSTDPTLFSQFPLLRDIVGYGPSFVVSHVSFHVRGQEALELHNFRAKFNIKLYLSRQWFSIALTKDRDRQL